MSRVERAEKRLDVESVVLPFLGSRSDDYQSFEYLLVDLSTSGVGLALPRWLASRELLHVGQCVHLHLPFELAGKLLHSGEVTWTRWDEEQEAQQVGVRLDVSSPAQYPVFVSLDTKQISIDLACFSGLEHILARVLKDSVLLKRGILVYLKHLAAYFSRVCDLEREEYALFREAIINEVRQNVQAHQGILAGLLLQAEDNGMEALRLLDLDELRRAMDPELYIDMFSAALGNETVGLFLKAIKELERKLLSNYNTCVLLYINSL